MLVKGAGTPRFSIPREFLTVVSGPKLIGCIGNDKTSNYWNIWNNLSIKLLFDCDNASNCDVLLLSPLLLQMLELWIKEFILHINYMAWQKLNNVHKHTCWNFKHFPLLTHMHCFWENWERESWFPVPEKFVWYAVIEQLSDQFFSFVEKECHSNFCFCIMCCQQMSSVCWSCKFQFSVSACKAFLAQSTSSFFPPEILIIV